jgi:hypothetical protein
MACAISDAGHIGYGDADHQGSGAAQDKGGTWRVQCHARVPKRVCPGEEQSGCSIREAVNEALASDFESWASSTSSMILPKVVSYLCGQRQFEWFHYRESYPRTHWNSFPLRREVTRL